MVNITFAITLLLAFDLAIESLALSCQIVDQPRTVNDTSSCFPTYQIVGTELNGIAGEIVRYRSGSDACGGCNVKSFTYLGEKTVKFNQSCGLNSGKG
jgi:hypothetical protein